MAELFSFPNDKEISYFENCNYSFDIENNEFEALAKGIDITENPDGLKFCFYQNIFIAFINYDESNGFALVFHDESSSQKIYRKFKKMQSSNKYGINDFRPTIQKFLTILFNGIKNKVDGMGDMLRIASGLNFSDEEKIRYKDILLRITPKAEIKEEEEDDVVIIEVVINERPITSRGSPPARRPVSVNNNESLNGNDENEINQTPEISHSQNRQGSVFEEIVSSMESNGRRTPPSSSKRKNQFDNDIDGGESSGFDDQEYIQTPKRRKQTTTSNSQYYSIFGNISENENSRNLDEEEENASDLSENGSQNLEVAPTDDDVSSEVNSITSDIEQTHNDEEEPQSPNNGSAAATPSNRNSVRLERKGFRLLQPNEYKLEHFIKPDGNELQQLIIYDPRNRNLCFTYCYNKKPDMFSCHPCKLENNKVNIKIRKNIKESVVYAKFGNNLEHVCQPQPEGQTILKPMFVFQATKKKGEMGKIIIFADEDKKTCYIFKHVQFNRYFCENCAKGMDKVRAKVFQDANGEYYVKIKVGKHNCNPVNYNKDNIDDSTTTFGSNNQQQSNADGNEQEHTQPLQQRLDAIGASFIAIQYDRELGEKMGLVKIDDYKLEYFTKSDGTITQQLTLYDPENEELCYTYFYGTRDGKFICNSCHAQKKSNAVRIYKDRETNEVYGVFSEKPHFCKPDPENLIICKPNFEVQKDEKGKMKLIIFASKNKELCYNFNLNPHSSNGYHCSSKECGYIVSAKIFEHTNGEYYVRIGDNGMHYCSPTKYLPITNPN